MNDEKGMKVGPFTLTAEDLAPGYAAMIAGPGIDYFENCDVAKALRRTTRFTGLNEGYLAGLLLQRARKAGLIRHRGRGRWVCCGGYPEISDEYLDAMQLQVDSLKPEGFKLTPISGSPRPHLDICSSQIGPVEEYSVCRTRSPFMPHRDTDGSPKGQDAERLDGEAATAGAEGIAQELSP